MLIDTHCHLDFPEFEPDRGEVISRAQKEGIGHIINIGSSLKGSEKSLELSRSYDFIYAAVGLHPHEADISDDSAKARIRELAGQDKVVAIGETGLDYYKNYSARDNQKALFRYLAGLAKDFDLPLVIHNREAQADTFKILNEFLPLRAVVHCFSGDGDFLKSCLGLGFYISFTCNITYKKAESLRGFLRETPLDRLMLETDAPFLPPEGLRGRRNEPSYVRLLAEEAARIKGVSFDEIAKSTTENAIRFFDLT
ncbi:MAG: TatD family hydrolase [Candidatus Omnitrophota bacterium]|jgi:TatD DNase family protein